MTKLNPIEAAVMPLKNDAIEKAAAYASQTIQNVLKNLAEHDMDASKAAPYPATTLRRSAYMVASMRYNLYRRVTGQDKQDARMLALKPWEVGRSSSTDIRKRDEEAEARYIENARKDAAAQYDAFVAKLVEKAGKIDGMPITRASLKGSHVWGYSFLTVELFDETTNTACLKRQVWKTQQIVNVSKLGKVFNQWPTRQVKT